MKFGERNREDIAIDLTPFIDVVLMLLLFFVISTTLFKGATQLGIQLPKANAQKMVTAENTLEIGVDANGNYFVNGKALASNDPKKLKNVLAKNIHKDNAAKVVLVGDRKAPHQAVVSALAVASALGVQQIQILAEKNET